MKRIMLPRLICLFCAGLLSLLAPWVWAEEKVEDGFYAVRRVSETREALLPLADDEIIVNYSSMFQEPGDKKEYVVITKDHHVPLSLKEMPVKVKDRTERTKFWLSICLTDDAARVLEELTKANIGKTGTIVINGESVTRHKIKSIIKDGKMVISRCADNACERLFLDLKDNVKSPYPEK
ncbi:MAG: hypothetical protein RDV48_22475 [Candidatus Eremiobacteraeota bacterium]|nr:hypothetical protein [Candidatus Eremiobacteraeota bacterium]